MRSTLRKFINHAVTDIVIGVMIVASIVFTVLEIKCHQTNLSHVYGYIAHGLNVIFIIELSIRFYVERSKKDFFWKYLIDIIAVIPFSAKFRILRIFRLFRLIRLGFLFTRRTRRMAAVLNKSLAENMLIVVTIGIVFLIGAVGMNLLEAEHMDASSAAWFSIFTLMAGEPTPGLPVTTAGRVITAIVMLGGFTMFAIFTGVVSAVMIERLRGGMDIKEVELEELKDHYVICGWNRCVPTIIRELQASPDTRSMPIVIMAEFKEEPELTFPGINRGLIFFISGDFSSTEVLRGARVGYAKHAILLADKSKDRSDQDRDARSILAALTIEKMRANRDAEDNEDGEDDMIYSCVELLHRDEQKVHVLKLAGVEDVVEGDEYMGNLIAHATRAHGLAQVIDELLTSTWGNEFIRVAIPPELVGKTYLEGLEFCKTRRNQLVIATAQGDKSQVNPLPGRVLTKEDELIVVHLAPDTAIVPKGSAARNEGIPVYSHPTHVSLDSLRAHFIICGWNRSVPKIVRQLRENEETRNAPIVVVAEMKETPKELDAALSCPRTFFVQGDYSATTVLEAVHVAKARCAVIVADKSILRSDQDRDARTILTALTIEKMNNHIYTCAELLHRDKEKTDLLVKANVEDILVGDEYVGNLLAQATRTHGLVHVMDELLTSNFGNEFRKIPVPDKFVGKCFVDALISLKQDQGALILAVESHENSCKEARGPSNAERFYFTNPPAQFNLSRGDYLFIITANVGMNLRKENV